MALVGGVVGLGMGFGLGCLRAQIPLGSLRHSELLFRSATLTLAAIFATSFYDPQMGSNWSF